MVTSAAVAGVPRPASNPAPMTASADTADVTRLCKIPPGFVGDDRFPPPRFRLALKASILDHITVLREEAVVCTATELRRRLIRTMPRPVSERLGPSSAKRLHWPCTGNALSAGNYRGRLPWRRPRRRATSEM